MADNIVAVTDATFDAEVLKSPIPALIDFWAVWCVPCKMIAPSVEEIAAEMKDHLKVCKMDVDASRMTPATYGVRGIPTLLLFKGGKVVEQLVGALPKDKIVETIKKHLG
jgi:thioredoxin 1